MDVSPTSRPLRNSARTRSLGAHAPRASLTRVTIALVALVVTLVQPLVNAHATAASTKIVLGPAEVRDRLFMAAELPRMTTGAYVFKDVVIERLLQEVFTLEPDISPTAALATFSYDTLLFPPGDLFTTMSANERSLYLLHELDSQLPPDQTTVQVRALRAVERQALSESLRAPDADARFDFAADDGASMARGVFNVANVLLTSARLADHNPSFARSRDELLGRFSQVHILDSEATLRSTAQVLGSDTLAPIVAQIAPDGSLTTDRPTILALNHARLDSTTAATSTMLHAINGDGPTSNDIAAANQKVRDDRVALALTASELPTVGDGQTAAAAVQYTGEAVAAFGGLVGSAAEAGTTLGKVGLAGGAIGLGIGLVSFALSASGIFGPDANEVIMSQLQAISNQIVELSKQVAQVQKQLNGRFDALDTAMTQLSSKLDKIQANLTTNTALVRSTLSGVSQLQQSVDRLASNLYAQNADAVDSKTYEDINYALGYRAHSPSGAAIPEDVFLRTESNFYTLGTSGAYNTIALPDRTPGPSGDNLYTDLHDNPIETNTEYLRSGIPSFLGLPPLTPDSDSPPNTHFWALATRAESQLLLENPQYVTPAIAAHLAALSDGGQRLTDLVAAIARGDTSAGTHSTLFNALLDAYRSRLSGTSGPVSVDTAAKAIETQYLSTLDGPAPDVTGHAADPHDTVNLAGFDPFHGASAQPDSYPAFPTTGPCDMTDKQSATSTTT